MAADRGDCAGTDGIRVSCRRSASVLLLQRAAPEWRNGRRYGLKNRWGQPRTGSSPVSGTTAECRKPAFDWAGSVCLTAKLTAKIMKRVVHPPSSSSWGNSVSISAVASRIVSGVGWVYRIVVLICECPRISFTTYIGTPCAKSNVAHG